MGGCSGWGIAGSGFPDTVTGDAFRRDWGLPSTLFTITKVS